MAEEQERVRTRDRGQMELVGYELSLKERADFQERQRTGRIVVKGSEQEWEKRSYSESPPHSSHQHQCHSSRSTSCSLLVRLGLR